MDAQLSHPSRPCQDANAAYSIALASLVRGGCPKTALQSAEAWADANACATVRGWLAESRTPERPFGWAHCGQATFGWVRWAFVITFWHLRRKTPFIQALHEVLAWCSDWLDLPCALLAAERALCLTYACCCDQQVEASQHKPWSEGRPNLQLATPFPYLLGTWIFVLCWAFSLSCIYCRTNKKHIASGPSFMWFGRTGLHPRPIPRMLSDDQEINPTQQQHCAIRRLAKPCIASGPVRPLIAMVCKPSPD